MHTVGVRNTDDTTPLHHLVCIQDVFHLRRIDVVTGADDHPLGPSAEIHKAFFIHHAQVTRVAPRSSIRMHAQGLCRFFRIVHITFHDGRTRKNDLSFFSVWKFFIRIRFHDFDIGIRERNADTALFMFGRRGQAARGDGLCSAIPFPDLDLCIVIVKETVKPFLQLDREGISAREHTFQAA